MLNYSNYAEHFYEINSDTQARMRARTDIKIGVRVMWWHAAIALMATRARW